MARAKDNDLSESFGASLSASHFLERYPWVDADALQTHIALTRAFVSLNDAMTKFLLPQGLELSRAQYNFLAVLSVAEDNRLSLTEIARDIGVSSPYVTKLVDTLERDGLVERVTSPLDRRITHVHLTANGQQRCQTIVPVFLRFVTQVAQSLTVEERGQLRSGADLRHRDEGRLAVEGASLCVTSVSRERPLDVAVCTHAVAATGLCH